MLRLLTVESCLNEAQILCVERIGPPQSFIVHGAGVLAEEHTDTGLSRLEREEAVREETSSYEKNDHEGHAEGRLGTYCFICSYKSHDIEDEECDREHEHCKNNKKHELAACGMGLLLDTHG